MLYLKFYFRSILSIWFNKVSHHLGGIFLFMDAKRRRDNLPILFFFFSPLLLLPTITHFVPLLLYIFYSLCIGKLPVCIGITTFHLLYITFVSLLIWYFYLICMPLSNYFALSEKYF